MSSAAQGNKNRRIYPVDIYPREVKAFMSLRGRVNRGVTTTCWEQNLAGFMEFLAYVGTVPLWMKEPSIGRVDHSKGYEPGNCGWQELQENRTHTDVVSRTRISENNKGKVPWNKGVSPTEETLLLMSEVSKLAWASGKMDHRRKKPPPSAEQKRKTAETMRLRWKEDAFDGANRPSSEQCSNGAKSFWYSMSEEERAAFIKRRKERQAELRRAKSDCDCF
jgi:hypothetical protein